MTEVRQINCVKYGEVLEGLSKPPFPGVKGKAVFEKVSKKAWSEWQQHQTMLINEKHLKVLEPSTQTYLHDQMWKFFNNEAFDKADGFVPKS